MDRSVGWSWLVVCQNVVPNIWLRDFLCALSVLLLFPFRNLSFSQGRLALSLAWLKVDRPRLVVFLGLKVSSIFNLDQALWFETRQNASVWKVVVEGFKEKIVFPQLSHLISFQSDSLAWSWKFQRKHCFGTIHIQRTKWKRGLINIYNSVTFKIICLPLK